MQTILKGNDKPGGQETTRSDVMIPVNAVDEGNEILKSLTTGEDDGDLDPRAKFHRLRIPPRPGPDDWATFMVRKPAGAGHWVTLRPTTEVMTTGAGGKTQLIPGQGKLDKSIIVKFHSGDYRTSDPNIILALLDSLNGYGVDYTINYKDPTGFWKKYGVIKTRPREIQEVVGIAEPAVAIESIRAQSAVVAGPQSTATRKG